MWTLYKHTNKINGKIYIGITGRSVERRWRANGDGYRRSVVFYSAIKKYGWDNFTHEILIDNLTQEEAEELEKKYISDLKANQREFGYNIANGGRTHALAEETKAKISDSLKDYYSDRTKHPRYGVKLSDELKKKLSDAHKGQPGANKGKHVPDEVREKIRHTMIEKNIRPPKEAHEKAKKARAKQKGNPSEKWLKVIKEVKSLPVNKMDKDGNFIQSYPSITEAATQNNLDGSNITAVCKKRRRFAGGYIWEYASESVTA